MIAVDDRLDMENARLADLTTQLVGVQGQRQDSQSRQQQSDNPDVLPDVLQSPIVASLKGQLDAAEITPRFIGEAVG